MEPPIPSQPIKHSFPAKKSLSPSQRKQKNSPNQKTNLLHNQNMGRGKSSAPHPHKETKKFEGGENNRIFGFFF
jgi:hypothetical protein